MGEGEVRDFLTHLAVVRRVAGATQNQALSALLFLYKGSLGAAAGVDRGSGAGEKPRRLIFSGKTQKLTPEEELLTSDKVLPATR